VVVVGMADPTNVFLIDEVKRKLKWDVKIVVTPAPTSSPGRADHDQRG